MIEGHEIVVRLLAALALGALVGIEREWRQKHAGLKTMTLVSLGAAGFAMMSDTFGPSNHNPAQMAAAVIGGIGFIGAGVIMHRGLTVQGVTTAATLWADASVGVASGLGYFTMAIALTCLILGVQFTLRTVEAMLHRLHHTEEGPARFELRVDCDPDTLEAVNRTWTGCAEAAGLSAVRRSVIRGPEFLTLRAVLRATGAAIDLTSFEEQIIALDGVRRVDVRHLGVEDE